MIKDIVNIFDLPSIDEVKKRSQALALLDAIFMPQWEFRYFSFNCNWDGNGKEMMGSMKDGSGGEYFLHFTDQGMVGKVLADEQLRNAITFLKKVPDQFSSFKNEPAFSTDKATFFFWRRNRDNSWFSSPGKLMAYPLLGFLVDGVLAYQNFVEEYFEKSIDRNVLEEIYYSLKVRPNQLLELNPEINIEEFDEDIKEIIGG